MDVGAAYVLHETFSFPYNEPVTRRKLRCGFISLLTNDISYATIYYEVSYVYVQEEADITLPNSAGSFWTDNPKYDT